ncbi:MAG: hypothetical protein ABFR97_06180 [Thermodesulfobacteriota bacterium]
MKKLRISWALAALLMMAAAPAVQAKKATINCKVMASKEKAVIMDCGAKSQRLQVGENYTLQVKKKRAIEEGC